MKHWEVMLCILGDKGGRARTICFPLLQQKSLPSLVNKIVLQKGQEWFHVKWCHHEHCILLGKVSHHFWFSASFTIVCVLEKIIDIRKVIECTVLWMLGYICIYHSVIFLLLYNNFLVYNGDSLIHALE